MEKHRSSVKQLCDYVVVNTKAANAATLNVLGMCKGLNARKKDWIHYISDQQYANVYDYSMDNFKKLFENTSSCV